jgi:hypothetical protein
MLSSLRRACDQVLLIASVRLMEVLRRLDSPRYNRTVIFVILKGCEIGFVTMIDLSHPSKT